jgi:hypothetical protein
MRTAPLFQMLRAENSPAKSRWPIVNNNILQCLRNFACDDSGLRQHCGQITMRINARNDGGLAAPAPL